MLKDYPTAKEMAERAAHKWSEVTMEEIFEEIERKSREGERYVYFFKTKLSKETRKTLRKLNYRYYRFMLDGAPGFKVSW